MLVLFLFVMLQDIISYRLTFHLSHISRYLHYLTCENNHELRSELCRGDERMPILVEILSIATTCKLVTCANLVLFIIFFSVLK